jgi:hypothetical protein
MMEHVCGPLTEKRVAIFSNNSPRVSWVQRMASRSSLVAEQLIWVLALRFNIQKVCPITMPHIASDQNSMTDIPSRLFGSEPKWHFKLDSDLLTFFNHTFTLPNQNSWTVCQPTSAVTTCVISVLRMTPFTLDDWRRLPGAGRNIGPTGKSMCHLWEWTLTFRIPLSPSASDFSQDLQHESKLATMATAVKSKVAQSVARSRPLARRLLWPVMPTLPKSGSERLLPCLQIMLDGYRKVDPATQKKLPVQLDVPELLVEMAYQPGTPERQRATADLTMIAFYYLLRVGEYTVKGARNSKKQTVQFKYDDVSFFKKTPTDNSNASHETPRLPSSPPPTEPH